MAALLIKRGILFKMCIRDRQKVVLKGEEPITCRPGLLLDPVDFDQLKKEVSEFRDDAERKDLISYAMYPKVYKDFCRHRKRCV